MLTEIYCEVDDYCKWFEQEIRVRSLSDRQTIRRGLPGLCLSEVLTLLIFYHLSHYKTFKHFYLEKALPELRADFPRLPAYNHFIELVPGALVPLLGFLEHRCRHGERTGKYFIDSSALPVCHPKRAHQNRVFKGFAAWGKTSVGWFFGLKYHLVINQMGELVGFSITPGSVADNDLRVLQGLTEGLFGWLFGDKGYLMNAQKRAAVERGGQLQVISKKRKSMKSAPKTTLEQRLWLAKRGIIESVIDIQKHGCDIAHSRHRSPVNAFVNILAALAAYSFLSRKPAVSVKAPLFINQPIDLAKAA